MALCLAPLATPLLAAGMNIFMQGKEALSAPAFAVSPTAPPTPAPAPVQARIEQHSLRETFADPFLSPQPIGSGLGLEKSAPQLQQASFRPRTRGAFVFRKVEVLDHLQLSGEGIVVSLAGVAPAPAGSVCRRVDGVVEPCAARAAGRLEILTKGHPVVCELTESEVGELLGACRAGKIDLAEDLVRNGLAVRTSRNL